MSGHDANGNQCANASARIPAPAAQVAPGSILAGVRPPRVRQASAVAASRAATKNGSFVP